MMNEKFRILGEEINVLEYKGTKITWDIDPLKLDAKKRDIILFQVEDIFSEEDKVNEEWALTHWSSEPIIVTKLNKKYVVLDGKHRLYRAKINGQKEIEAYFFEEDELEKYII